MKKLLPSKHSLRGVTKFEDFCSNSCKEQSKCGPFKKWIICKTSALYFKIELEYKSIIRDLEKTIDEERKFFKIQVENFRKKLKEEKNDD